MKNRQDRASNRGKKSQRNSIFQFVENRISTRNSERHSVSRGIPKSILARANPNDLNVVQEWHESKLNALLTSLSSETVDSLQEVIDVLIYYENIGLAEKSIDVAESLLRVAKEKGDTALRRRSHNILGSYYSKVCNFNASFFHTKHAYNLALQLGEPSFILASLSNAAVALHEAGLNHGAKELSLRASQISDEGEILSLSHLINANNGIKVSHIVGDDDSAECFYKISLKHIKANNSRITGVTRAYFDASTAEHLISLGKEARAIDMLEKAVIRQAGGCNGRVAALLTCALARGYLKAGESRKLVSCKEKLVQLLPLTTFVTVEHEDILLTLIRISEAEVTAGGRREQLQYSRRLREYLLTRRHGQFFVSIANSYANHQECDRGVADPINGARIWTAETFGLEDSGLVASSFDGSDCTMSRAACQRTRTSRTEERLKSRQFEIAEDWAVAAELLTGGNWMHCFGVGELVRILAVGCNMSPRRSIEVGLAARLHDIGKIATVEDSNPKDGIARLAEFGVNRRHAEVGTTLLSASPEPLLQLAAKIAGHHHEWWNGCGAPNGLRGEDIPIEARLCAVADAFVDLVQPQVGQRWATSEAIKQISSMSGVQLDPALVEMLLQIVQASDGAASIAAWEHGSERNNLLRIKKSLFETLELSV